jgi:hypothetical protein
VRLWISVFLLCCVCAMAGPIDFGLDEYNAAVEARHLKWKVKYELTPDPPETYRIEPYAVGGAHVTGGDLRGLMYGLLEAADQIRTTGRMKQVHAEPSTPVRGVRMFANASDLEAPDTWWRSYFQTLARDRFNRITLIFTALPANYERLRAVSQLASDYAVDFTLGLWEHSPGNGWTKLIASVPQLRAVEILSDSHDPDTYRTAVFKPLRDAGHRIALDPEGTLTGPEFLKLATQMGVALRFDAPAWPPSFTIDLPRELEQHSELYWLWGRAAYDRKIKPAHGENAAEFQAAARITTLIAAAQTADPRIFTIPEAIRPAPEEAAAENDWIASIPEAVRDRLEHGASAKQTPLEIADALAASSAALEKSALPDFQLLAKLARFHAHNERAAYEIELFDRTKDGAALDRAERELSSAHALFDVADSRVGDRKQADGITSGGSLPPAPKRLPRPQFVHLPVKSSPSDQPINLTLQIGVVKDLRTVRLHYRAADSSGLTTVIEKPAAATMTFTIPPASADLIYYFEILNRENTGWFEPDPDQTRPSQLLRIEIK